jgi:hypothetical protein
MFPYPFGALELVAVVGIVVPCAFFVACDPCVTSVAWTTVPGTEEYSTFPSQID